MIKFNFLNYNSQKRFKILFFFYFNFIRHYYWNHCYFLFFSLMICLSPGNNQILIGEGLGFECVLFWKIFISSKHTILKRKKFSSIYSHLSLHSLLLNIQIFNYSNIFYFFLKIYILCSKIYWFTFSNDL
jgi:hypothetical protein